MNPLDNSIILHLRLGKYITMRTTCNIENTWTQRSWNTDMSATYVCLKMRLHPVENLYPL